MTIFSNRHFLSPLPVSRILTVTGIVLLSICMGFTVYWTLTNTISIFYTGILFFLMILPFILIWNKFAKKICIALLILTIPLIIDKTFNLHEFHQGGAKGYIVSLHDIVLVVLYIIVFFQMYRTRTGKLRMFAKYSIPFWGIMVMAAISMINAEYRFYSTYELIEIFKMYLVFLFIANYINDTGDANVILNFIVIGLIIEILFVMLELVSGQSFGIAALGTQAVEDPGQYRYMRLGGTFGGSNGLAWYLDIMLPVVLALFLSKITTLKKSILFIVLIGGFISLVLTYSRGGWIAFFIAAMITAFFIFMKFEMIRKIRIALFALVIAAVALAAILGTENSIKSRLTEDDKGSATSRLPLMELAVDIIKSEPVTGIGLNNYTEVHHKYDFGVDKITDYYPVPVHNVFLMVGAEIGLPGLIFFVLFFVMIFANVFRYYRRHDGFNANVLIGIIGGITGFLIQGLVENSSLGSINFFPVWILSGVAVGIIERDKRL